MYTFLLIAQVLAIILSFVCVVLLIFQKSSTATRLMLITCLSCFVQNCGYFLEMQSRSLKEAMISIRFEYIGGSFICTLLMIFVFKYCRVKLIDWIVWFAAIVDILVLVSVWLYEYVPLYYTKVDFVETGLFPHVVLSKGILYIIFSVVMYGQFIASAVVSMMSALKTTDHNMRKNYWMLFLCCTVPCFFYMFGVIDVLDGYDSAPIGGAVGLAIFGFAIISRHVFDVVETAHENILMELEDAIVILDYKRGFQEANRAAIALFPELENTSFGQLVPNAAFNELLDLGEQDEVKIEGRFYKVHVNELYARNGIDSSFIGYSVVMFDVTQSREQYLKMDELRIEADSANQAKSAFLANVSHEIRTPINVVVGMSDVILRDYDDPQLCGYVHNIQSAANNLLELINDILDFSKIESGRVDVIRDDYPVDEFFKDILMVFTHKSQEKGLSFTTSIAPTIPRVLNGDVVRIKQILTNVLGNAFKYTREGGVTLKAIFEKIDEDRGNLIMSVEDTGIGIKKEEIDKVFELFVRLDERLNRSVEGTGLGLNITKKLIELMGGEIKVYSEYGKGSVFTIIIPQIVKSAPNEFIGELSFEDTYVKHEGIGYEAAKASILIVDDSKTNLIVAKALLRDTLSTVTTASSGEECLNLVAANHYDVIFLDHRMPKMDGIETLHRMNNMDHLCKDTPIIMLTANAVSNAREYYMNEGFTDFISKPICEESITQILKKYLPEELVKEK